MLHGAEQDLSRLARQGAIPLACALAFAVAAGCGDVIAPGATSGTSGDDVGVQASQSDRPPEVSTVPVSFFAFNPCIGAVEEFTGTATLRLHEFFLPPQTGRGHMVSRVTEDLETASGFSGISTSTIVFNGIPGTPPEQAAFTGAQAVQLSHADGRRVIVRLLVHATFVNGEFVVEFESVNQRCVGPDEA
jgi:hypothetical protein